MSTLAVVSQSGESLSFFDAAGNLTGKVTDLTAEPHELCHDDRTNLLYISHAYAHGWYNEHGAFVREISVLDCATRKVVDTIDVSPAGGTHFLAIDKQRDILWASIEDGLSSSPNAGGVVGIDLKTRKVVTSIESGYRTHWFAMTPDGTRAFTCNKEAGFISVLDLVQRRLVRKIDIPGGSEQPDISTDGKLAYFPITSKSTATHSFSQVSVAVIDAASAQITQTIPLDKAAVSIHITSTDQILVGQFTLRTSGAPTAGNVSSGGITVLSSAADGHRRLGNVETGQIPLTIYSSPDGRTAYLANIFKGTVDVVDLQTLEIVQTLNVDLERRADKKMHNGAHGMALIP